MPRLAITRVIDPSDRSTRKISARHNPGIGIISVSER